MSQIRISQIDETTRNKTNVLNLDRTYPIN